MLLTTALRNQLSMSPPRESRWKSGHEAERTLQPHPVKLSSKFTLSRKRGFPNGHLDKTLVPQRFIYQPDEASFTKAFGRSDRRDPDLDKWTSRASSSDALNSWPTPGAYADRSNGNSYSYPPKPRRFVRMTLAMRLKDYWAFVRTPFGLLMAVYGLNIAAWGGMLIVRICNVAPAMCHPTCSEFNSPRMVWIEIDTRILTVLISLWVLWLSPQRLREAYFLLQYQVLRKREGLRRLAGIHRDWFRLPGSGCRACRKHSSINLLANDSSVPVPPTKAPELPVTGVYAPPTKIWRLDFVIWMSVANIVCQAVLVGLVWGFDRVNRPWWSEATFLGLACAVAAGSWSLKIFEKRKVQWIEVEHSPEGAQLRYCKVYAMDDNV